MYKILLWGVGDRTKYYIDLDYFSECNIYGFICTQKEMDLFQGKKIYSIGELLQVQNEVDYIVIANEFYEEILNTCSTLGIDTDKLVMTDNIPLEPYRTYYKRLEKLSKDLFELLEKTPYILVKRNESDIVDREMRMGKGKYSRSIYMQDYFRFRTFELVALDIRKKNLKGAVAELGVFRGHFSSLINEWFSDRILYLFDTFDGFDKNEADAEIQKGQCGERFIKEHKDTSVERMLLNLPYPERTYICRGLFPQSISEQAEKEQFVFVSIDVDFEESMYQGLKFFYPRMVNGGVIFVHDYNTYFLDGIKTAVSRYEKEMGEDLYRIPIADRAGTLVIIKK